MKVYVVIRQAIPDSSLVAVERKLLAAQEAAQADADTRGEGKIPGWAIPATDDWRAHGRPADAEPGAYYELVETNV